MSHIPEPPRKSWRHFRIHWRDGDIQDVSGYGIADACNRAGIGGGAAPAIDYWEETHAMVEQKEEGK